MNKKKVSIIIPIYNVEDYIADCIESVINQTETDIEIICIDDNSTDDSLNILKDYASKDNRIIILSHETNLSASQSRKDGVLCSRGDYIMFVDGDDNLEPDACEKAYKAIKKYKVDILHFDTNIINCEMVSEGRIIANEKALKPYYGKLFGDLVHKCWVDKKFGFQLWNKIYNGNICRRAFEDVEDGCYPKAQDLYAFFLIAHHSRSYRGVHGHLYNYNFGIGVTGSDALDLNKYELLLKQKLVYNAIENYIDKNNLEAYEDIKSYLYRHFLNECVDKLYRYMVSDYLSQGFRSLCETWGFQEVLGKLAERKWYQRSELVQRLKSVDYFDHKKRTDKGIKSVAAYYRCISNGGAQRVVAMLCNMWANAKDEKGNYLYHVILITDREPTENEYFVDDKVFREYLPDNEISIKDLYKDRLLKWHEILEKHDIDIVINSLWTAPCTIWDMMAVKGYKTKPAYLIHSHNFCAFPYKTTDNMALDVVSTYRFCDGVVALSNCDKLFVSGFNANVKNIINPIHFEDLKEDNLKHKKLDKTIIWAQRIAYEKRPLDVVKMMSFVVKKMPEARLLIVGEGSEALTQKISEEIVNNELSDNIEIVGFINDIQPFYERSALCVITSEYEGFPLVIMEALFCKTPVITYDMPWLTLIEDGRGIVTVPQANVRMLADKVVELLSNDEMLENLSIEAGDHINKNTNSYILQDWISFFNEIENTDKLDPDNKELSIVLSEITNFHMKSIRSLKGRAGYEGDLNIILNKVTGSISFRVGRAITWLPRKIRDLIFREKAR